MRLRILIPVLLLCLYISAASFSARADYAGFEDPGAHAGGGTASANGGLVPVAEVVDGGKIPIGATGQVVVRFRNDGSQPVETGLIRLYPSSTVSASVALNQCEEEPLASGAECAIALSVKGLQAGPWRVEMLMSHSGRTRLVTSAITGVVEASGDSADKLVSDIQAIPDAIDFGTLDSSQTLTKPVILKNITSTPIDIKKIYIDSSEQSGYLMKTECKRLEAGQTCIVVITWAPKLKGRVSGVIVIQHNGPAALTSVPLIGEYAPQVATQADVFPPAVPGKGLLVASQTEIDFGNTVQTASTITVSLVNAGDAPVKLKEIKISGADNGLNYKEDGCEKDMVLEPIEACPLTITWSPTRVGSVFDDVQIAHDGARGVLVLPIRGTSTSSVSQDQKAIVLSDSMVALPSNPGPPGPPGSGTAPSPLENAPPETVSFQASPNVNPSSVLDGYKITSFSPTRAIINGPGGSRIVFDNEEIVLGGIPWFVVIQKNGIEFVYQGQRILLLFDRSLSSINRISASSDEKKGSGPGGSTGTSSSTSAPATPAASTTSGGTNG